MKEIARLILSLAALFILGCQLTSSNLQGASKFSIADQERIDKQSQEGLMRDIR